MFALQSLPGGFGLQGSKQGVAAGVHNLNVLLVNPQMRADILSGGFRNGDHPICNSGPPVGVFQADPIVDRNPSLDRGPVDQRNYVRDSHNQGAGAAFRNRCHFGGVIEVEAIGIDPAASSGGWVVGSAATASRSPFLTTRVSDCRSYRARSHGRPSARGAQSDWP